jgi:glucose/arabinose dehydrogenase
MTGPRWCWGALLLAACAAPAAAEFECRWAESPVTIDGKADDPAWANAQVIDQFSLPWLGKDARPAKTGTRARLLWDRESFYFFADMDDADLHAEVADHDGRLWGNDVFEIFLKPAAKNGGYYEFEFNPANAVLDMFLPQRIPDGYANYKGGHDFVIQTAVQRRGTLNRRDDRDQGWSVEGRIAWRSLMPTGGRPEPDERWTFALCRVDDSKGQDRPELSTCAPLKSLPHADFHHYEDYAPLRFVGPTSRTVTSLPPLTTSRVVGSPDPPPPYRAVRAYPNLKVPFPICVARQPGSDRLLVISESSSYGPTRLLRIADDSKVDSFETLLTLDAVAYDVAFHPNFLKNGYFYVGLNGPSSRDPKRTQVVRYRLDPKPPYALDPKSATVIIEWESNGHNGGAIDFGPDGLLYVSSGDGTSDSDQWLSGQDLSRLLGKVLRIDVDHPAPGKQYSVPKDNPFVGQKNVRPETWAYGLRNPWRLEFDRQTGQLWVGNNGQDQWEQVYLIQPGANYGWSVIEGGHWFYPSRARGPHAFVKPTLEHPHSEARSLTGGTVYVGSPLPDLRGAYLYGDYSTGKVWAARHDGTKLLWHREIADTTLHITSFAADSRGELLITDHVADGGFYRLEPARRDSSAVAASRSFPRRLSESGLFASVKGHVMRPGVLPYSVNAELWSDGAYKERFIAIPKAGDDRRIGVTATRGWEFPDETVIVKSFALEAEAGNAGSRRWVETRFMTKQQGEWAGYSYAWNDEQTDATLVDAGGADRTYAIRDPRASGGARRQAWHYPSRAECMVCHSRAANFVLGLSALQLNKEHDYGAGGTDNQLRVMEQLGLLKVDWAAQAESALKADGAARGLAGKKLAEYVERQKAAGAAKGTPASMTSRLLPQSPDQTPHLVNPYDATADLNARARSYLHSNCAQCHVEAGGGNAQMELEFTTAPDKTRLFDVRPLHNSFDLADARLLAPGSPDRSVLLKRMTLRGPGQMPPLATSVVDERAVNLIREWIAEQKQ